jgi:virulence-associated protein VagC
LPKAVIEQVGFDDEVEIVVENQRLVITPANRPRAGWAEAVQKLGSEPVQELADSATRFDETEWQW